jgi:transcription-repair coupling factor (superfamily II helicase)
LASVAFEGEQVVMRFPPLPEGMHERSLPSLGREVRAGRNAYWMVPGKEDWQTRLLETLASIVEVSEPDF